MCIIRLVLMVNMLCWIKLVKLIFRLKLNPMVDTLICILCCIVLALAIIPLFLPAPLFLVILVVFLLTLLTLLIWYNLQKDGSANFLLRNALFLTMIIALGLLVSCLAVLLAMVPIVLVLELLIL